MAPSRGIGSMLSWLGSSLTQSWREDVTRALRSYYWNSTTAVRELLGLPADAGPDSFAGFPLASLDVDVRTVSPGDAPGLARASVRVRAVANPQWDPAATSVDADLDVLVARDGQRQFMFFMPGRYGATVRDVRVVVRRPG